MRHTARKPTGNFQTTSQQVVLLLPRLSLGEVEPALSAIEPPNGVIHFLGWQSALPRFCITQGSILGANFQDPANHEHSYVGCAAMLLRDFAPRPQPEWRRAPANELTKRNLVPIRSPGPLVSNAEFAENSSIQPPAASA
jgi:hypothetical protein